MAEPTGTARAASTAGGEEAVRSCYATWSTRYYDEYYSGQAYPPVHVGLVRDLLRDAGARTLLDAGCGPASMLRDLADLDLERWGFDLTPGMIEEARRVLAEQGLPGARLWQGSVLDAAAFRAGPDCPEGGFDAAICFGVLPHVPEEADRAVLAHLRDAVRPGGLVALEARNQLFALFTLNRYSRDLFREVLIDSDRLTRMARDADERSALEQGLAEMDARFRTDLPPVRKGYDAEPGYDEILSRTHNPLALAAAARELGLDAVETLFYHFHAVPPMLEERAPRLFREASLALEDPRDWRGHVMASAFVLVGRRAA